MPGSMKTGQMYVQVPTEGRVIESVTREEVQDGNLVKLHMVS